MSVIDEIKDRVDIVELVSESVPLRRSGKNYVGFCPFHPNQRTPAFAVFPDSGTWRCFGQCNEGGDIFRFVMKKEGCDFGEALRILAERAGVTLRTLSPEEQEASEEHERLRQILEEALIFYRHQLFHTSAGAPVLEYLQQQRHLKVETLEAFGIGYAPPGWEVTLDYFLERGASIEDLLAVGLVVERQQGGSHRLQKGDVYDRFRQRIMFPIRDEKGRMAGFGARALSPDDLPKFLNSPQTALFDKGRLLYGLDRAIKAIREKEHVVLVEGYLDVVALHQAGFLNVVSPMGTALTEHQMRMLKRYTKHIVLALDADAAGAQATLRGLEVARQAMDRETEPVFDARGLLGYEARLQADIRVCTLPAGMDPDEVVARNPQEWQALVAQARSVVEHVMETLAATRDLDDPKVKTEVASQVMPLIEELPSPIERDTYRQRLARLLRVTEEALEEFKPEKRRRRPKARQATPSESEVPPRPARPSWETGVYRMEVMCLSVLLRQPTLIYQVDRRLQDRRLSRLGIQDFQHAEHQAIIRLLLEAVEQDLEDPHRYVISRLTGEVKELVEALVASSSEFDSTDERVLSELMRGLLLLRRRRVDQELEYHHFVMREAQEKGDLHLSQETQYVVQLAQMRRYIDQALHDYAERAASARLTLGR